MSRAFIPLLLAAFLFPAVSCGGSSDPHCRLYLVTDGTGTFDELHVVESPNNGTWGPDLLLEPAEYLTDEPTWRVFRFPAGHTFDLRMPVTVGGHSYVKESLDSRCRDCEGIKYDIDGGNLFTTTFTFDH